VSFARRRYPAPRRRRNNDVTAANRGRDLVDGRALEIAVRGHHARGTNVFSVLRIANEPDDVIAAIGEQAPESDRDLAMRSRDCNSHSSAPVRVE
jgi:hypothetical protein